jgi:hypothetical protein
LSKYGLGNTLGDFLQKHLVTLMITQKKTRMGNGSAIERAFCNLRVVHFAMHVSCQRMSL